MKIGYALLLLMPVVASAQVYRWVDSKGGVHYTQTPPASGDYQQLPQGTAPPVETNPQQQSIDQFLQATEKAEQERLRAEAESKAKSLRAEAVTKLCEAARERLRTIDASPPRRLMIENADGSQSRMTVEGWEQRRAETQKLIAESCK